MINFIENDSKNDNKNLFQKIINIIQKQKILETPEESKILLQLISTISVNHPRVPFDETNIDCFTIPSHDNKINVL